MTTLDKLITLAGVRGSMDLRCNFAGRWVIDHQMDGPGTARYHIVLAGSCQLRLPDSSLIQLRTGDILLLPHGTDHLLRSGPDVDQASRPVIVRKGLLPMHRLEGEGEPLDLLCGRFLYQPESSLFSALPQYIHVCFDSSNSASGLSAIIDFIRSEAEQNNHGARSIVDAMTTALFTMVLRSWLDSSPPAQSSIGLLADRRLSKVWHALLEAPSEPWTVERMANIANMSRASFMRAFNRVAGCPPGALLIRIRMEIACLLLVKTDHGLSDIALQAGYQTQASFSKVFKDALGQTPGQYRRERQTEEMDVR
jgi:AraC family transcriptional activator of mtrCDE